MSLAVATATSLTIIDRTSLKRDVNSYDAHSTLMPATPISLAWSSDNSNLYVASSSAIYSFSSTSRTLTTLYNTKSSEELPLQPVLVCKDRTSLIFSQGSAIHLLAIGSSSLKISNSLIGHSSPITSLSLCNDASLLASTSVSGTVCVHNLGHNSLTVLKGLPTRPLTYSKNMTCTFHPHTRTRLLVGYGDTVVVYDTSRPATPIKSIVISEKDSAGCARNIGHVAAISCSPYSKTLVLVAFNSGFIALLDLGKDSPYFKNLVLRVPVTSMVFTADGSSVTLGTENGKVIVVDLRDLEHGRRELPIGNDGGGERIIGLSMQRRIKSPSTTTATGAKSIAMTTAKKPPVSLSTPLTQYDLNNPRTVTKVQHTITSSTNTKVRVTPVTPSKDKHMREQSPKRVFSPPKILVLTDGGTDTSSGDVVIEKVKMNEARDPAVAERDGSKCRPMRKTSTTSRSTSASGQNRPASASSPSRFSSRSGTISRSGSGGTAPDKVKLKAISNTRSLPCDLSGSSKEPYPGSTNTISKTSQSNVSQIEGVMSGLEAMRYVNLPIGDNKHTTNPAQNYSDGIISVIRSVRTPTPNPCSADEGSRLVADDELEESDIAISNSKVLATPEVERWIQAGHAGQSLFPKVATVEVKHVGWVDSNGSVIARETGGDVAEIGGDHKTVSPADHGTWQTLIEKRSISPENANVSPMRRLSVASEVMQLSPLRDNVGGSNDGGNGGAQELLRAVVKDIMFDHHQETREDIRRLHLDLLRMGRSWKSELRSLMNGYGGDLKELREENARLRKENDRLRRGF